MALSGPRNLPRRSTYYFESEAPVGANAVLYQGALAVINASGYLVPGSAATTHKNPCVVDTDNGRRSVANTGGSNGAIAARIWFGVFPFASGTSGDALTQADVGKTVYIIDDQTVGKTDGSGTRSAAGVLMHIDSDGYWVSLRHP